MEQFFNSLWNRSVTVDQLLRGLIRASRVRA